MFRPLALSAALAALACAAGCGRPAGPEKRDPAAPRAEAAARATPMIFRVGNGAEPQDLDPQTVTGVPEHHILMALFEGLLAENPRDLSPEPGVAERWEVSADGLVYTFHLRADAQWSDGVPINATTFVRSYQRMLTPALGAEYANMLHPVKNARAYQEGRLADFAQVGFHAVDPRTLRITLEAPTPFLLKAITSHYSWYPVPIHVVERWGGLARKGTPWTRAENIVSNGPFVVQEWRPQQVLVAARNPRYWDRARVRLDEIHFFPIENQDSEERLFRTGKLDATSELPLAKIDVYRRERPESLRIDPYLGLYFYRFNTTRPPLNDRRVRRALALALDRESLVKNVVRGGQQPAYSVSYPGTAGYTPTARLTGTLEEARRLLADAGFPGGRGLRPLELLYNTSQNHRVIAEAIQQMWRRHLGLEITLRNEEWKVYLDTTDALKFDLQRGGWIADYLDPHTFLEIWTSTNLNNDTGWSHPDYDQLFREALAAPDDAARYAVYQRMDALLVEEMPVIPIYFYTSVKALSPRVKGLHPTLLDSHPFKHLWLE